MPRERRLGSLAGMKPADIKHLTPTLPVKARDVASLSVAGGLSRAVHEHRLAPGVKLGEDDMGEIYGVSRIFFRAALRQLAHTGLVQMKRNRGAHVAQPTLRIAANDGRQAEALMSSHLRNRTAPAQTLRAGLLGNV